MKFLFLISFSHSLVKPKEEAIAIEPNSAYIYWDPAATSSLYLATMLLNWYLFARPPP